MATSPPGFRVCGTGATGWVKDPHPEEVGSSSNVTVCFQDGIDECGATMPAVVTNCDQFFSYYLQDSPWCFRRYCGYDGMEV